MVLRVHLEVLGEVRDALGKECNLDLRGPGVARSASEFLYNFCLLNSGQTHVTLGFSWFFCASMSYETLVESTRNLGFLRPARRCRRRRPHVEGSQRPDRARLPRLDHR